MKSIIATVEIPQAPVKDEKFDKGYGYDVVVSNSDLNSNYGIHPATIRKLQGNGTIKGRDLKRKNGTVYKTLYLVSENEEFFETHPKNQQ